MPDDAASAPDWAARRKAIARDRQARYAAHVRAGTGDHAPGPMENDARVYTDPARYARECETLFRDTPLLAGLSGDLPEPGSVILFEALDTSVLLTRNTSGEVRAFLNMCAHRGAKLIDAPCRRKLVTCPFHGWSFDLDGKLVALPEPEAFEAIDRAARSLVSVPVREWAGMIFILPRAGEEAIDLETHLGEFAPELEQLELARAEPVKSGILQADCNWKYALDTYGEGYHFPSLHKETVALISLTNQVYERFGRHHRVGWASSDVPDWADKPESEWPEPFYSAVHYLFPNTVIFVGTVTGSDPFVQIFRHFPDGVGAMHTKFAVYAPEGVTSEAYRAEVEAGFDGTAHVVDTEDYWVARNGWAQLKSAPAGFKVLYGANEIALQNQHKALAEAAGMPLDIYD